MKKTRLDPFEEESQERKGVPKKLLVGLFLAVFVTGILAFLLLSIQPRTQYFRPPSWKEEFERVTKEKIYTIARSGREVLERLEEEEIRRIAEVLGVSPEEVRRAIMEERLTEREIVKILEGRVDEGELAYIREKLKGDPVERAAGVLGIEKNVLEKLIERGAVSREDIGRVLAGDAEAVRKVRRIYEEEVRRIAERFGIPEEEARRLISSNPDVLTGGEREFVREIVRKVSERLGIAEDEVEKVLEKNPELLGSLVRILEGNASAEDLKRVAKAFGTEKALELFLPGFDGKEVLEVFERNPEAVVALRRVLKGNFDGDDLRLVLEAFGPEFTAKLLPEVIPEERLVEILRKNGETAELIAKVLRGEAPIEELERKVGKLVPDEVKELAKELGIPERELLEDGRLLEALERIAKGDVREEDVRYLVKKLGRERVKRLVRSGKVARKLGVSERSIRKLLEEEPELLAPLIRASRDREKPGDTERILSALREERHRKVEREIVRRRKEELVHPAEVKSPVDVLSETLAGEVPSAVPERKPEIGAIVYGREEPEEKKEEERRKEKEEERKPVYALPDGGYFIATLMDSIVAVEGFTYDLLLVADSDYYTPKGTFPFKDCTVSVKVQANPVSRRIEPVKVNAITCILDDGRFYRAENVSGYFADYEDNVRGLKGVLKTADIQKAFFLVLGQVAQTGGTALSLSAIATTTTPFGQTQEVEAAGRFMAGTALRATGEAIMEVLESLGKKYVDYIVVEPMNGEPRKVYFYITSPVRFYPFGLEEVRGE